MLNFTEPPFTDERIDGAHLGAVAVLEVYGEQATGVFRGLDHRVGFAHMNRHRFLYQYVAASLEAVYSHVGVKRVRGHHDGYIGLGLFEHSVVVLKKRAAQLGRTFTALLNV